MALLAGVCPAGVDLVQARIRQGDHKGLEGQGLGPCIITLPDPVDPLCPLPNPPGGPAECLLQVKLLTCLSTCNFAPLDQQDLSTLKFGGKKVSRVDR